MVKRFFSKINDRSFSQKSIPAALMAIAVVAFGLLIFELGFYWDDWERIFVLKIYDVSAFWDYFSTKRPFAAWIYVLFGPLLQGNPLGWHVLSLAARWLSAVCFWWVLRSIWPSNKHQAFYASALFLIYPIFLQQSIIVYFKHWLAFSFYFLSLGLMVQVFRKPQYRFVYLFGAVIMQLLHLSLLEYYAGLELLKPFILYLLFKNTQTTYRKAIWQSFINWLPYLVVLVVYAVWRLSFGASLEDNPYNPQLLIGMISSPLATLRDLANIGLQDSIYIFISAWYKTLQPGVISLNTPFTLLAWGGAFVLALGMTYYMLHLKDEENPRTHPDGWPFQAFGVGILAAGLGALPVWITFRAVSTEGLFTDRFAMACMAGASLAWVAVLEWLVNHPKKRIIVLNLLILVGVSLQLRTANDFRWSWIRQQRTFWQLYWRAPYIQPNSAILTNNPLFAYSFPQFSFNLLYREPKDNHDKGGYIFSYLGDFAKDQDNWIKGKELKIDYLLFHYQASTKNSIVIFREEKTGNCLWVLDETDSENPYLPDVIRQALPISNLSRIESSPKEGHTPLPDVFGLEPEKNWCYYYEKIDLAAQNQDYERAARLADEAISLGYSISSSAANSPQEWTPVIESFAATGRWQEAFDITQKSMQVDSNYRPMLCSLWKRIENGAKEGEGAPVISEVYDSLECGPYFN